MLDAWNEKIAVKKRKKFEKIEWCSGMMVSEHRREQMKRWKSCKWKMRGHSGKESESEDEEYNEDEMEPCLKPAFI